METEIITKAFEALDKAAAAVGQTAAEYWPQWVARCVFREWLLVGVWGFVVLALGLLGGLLIRVAGIQSGKLEPVPDGWGGKRHAGFELNVLGCVCIVGAALFCIPVLTHLYDAIMVSLYPEIYAAEELLKTITGGCR